MTKSAFPVVGIGASASGLDAFHKFFDHMSADCGELILNNDTVYGNIAGNGDDGGLSTGNLTMSHTVLAGNGLDCTSTLTDLGHNLLQNPGYPDGAVACVAAASTLTGVDPKLGPLQIDEGTLPTKSPLANSPAIGAGSTATPGNNSGGACTALDERGIARGVAGACTIGAAEALGSLHVTRVTPTNTVPVAVRRWSSSTAAASFKAAQRSCVPQPQRSRRHRPRSRRTATRSPSSSI